MKPTWLYGPPARSESGPDSASLAVSGVHVLNVDDIHELVEDAQTLLRVKPRVVRLEGGPEAGMWVPSKDEIDLRGASDADLAKIGLVAYSAVEPGLWVSLEIRLGAITFPSMMLSLTGNVPQLQQELPTNLPAFARRVADVLNGSRRRVPTWKWAQAATRLVPVAAFVVWAGFAISVWPNIWAAAVGALAAAAFSPTAVRTVREFQNRRSLGPNSGRVLVDATPRNEIRAARANSRRDLRVGAITAAVTAVLTVAATVLFTGAA